MKVVITVSSMVNGQWSMVHGQHVHDLVSRKILLAAGLLLGLIMPSMLSAQDAYFSQYFSSPMNLNPAMVGNGVNDWRLLGTYRSQSMGEGTKPYTTTAVSVEKNILSGSVRKDKLAFGAMMLNESSNGGLLKHNFLSGAISYHNALDANGKHTLGGGISFSFANRVLDVPNFLFQSQFMSGGYQPEVIPTDGGALSDRVYIDINTGLLYNYKTERSGFYTGISYFHANKPNDGMYTNTKYQVNPRLSLQAGYRTLISNANEIQFSSIYEKQGEISRVSAGVIYKQSINAGNNGIQLSSVNLGVWARTGEAIVPYIGLDGKSWLLGFTYDVPTGKLAQSFSSMRSFEISFGILFGKKADEREVVVY